MLIYLKALLIKCKLTTHRHSELHHHFHPHHKYKTKVGANPGPKSKAEQNVSSASQSSSPPMTVSQVRNPFKVPTQFQRNYSTRPITNQESDTKKEIVITQYYWQHRNQEYLLAIHLIVVITNLRKRKALMKHNLKQKCKANHFVK